MENVILFLRSGTVEGLRVQEAQLRHRLDRLGVDHKDAIVFRRTRSSMAHKVAIKRLEKLVSGEVAWTVACADLTRLGRSMTPMRLLRQIYAQGGKVLTLYDHVETATLAYSLSV